MVPYFGTLDRNNAGTSKHCSTWALLFFLQKYPNSVERTSGTFLINTYVVTNYVYPVKICS